MYIISPHSNWTFGRKTINEFEPERINVIETCGPPPAKRIRLISAQRDLSEVRVVTSGSSTTKKKRAILSESDVSVETRGPPPAKKNTVDYFGN